MNRLALIAALGLPIRSQHTRSMPHRGPTRRLRISPLVVQPSPPVDAASAAPRQPQPHDPDAGRPAATTPVEAALMGTLILCAILPLLVWGLASLTGAVMESWEARRARRRDARGY